MRTCWGCDPQRPFTRIFLLCVCMCMFPPWGTEAEVMKCSLLIQLEMLGIHLHTWYTHTHIHTQNTSANPIHFKVTSHHLCVCVCVCGGGLMTFPFKGNNIWDNLSLNMIIPYNTLQSFNIGHNYWSTLSFTLCFMCIQVAYIHIHLCCRFTCEHSLVSSCFSDTLSTLTSKHKCTFDLPEVTFCSETRQG